MLERQRHQAVTLPEQDEEEMLAVERVVAQLQEQLLRASERLSGLLGKLFNGDHRLSPPETGLHQSQGSRSTPET
jgi:hypothetical protein